MGSLPHSAINDGHLTREENKLFFKRWLRAPGRLGTFAPISTRLARNAAARVDVSKNPLVVELGAGTGRLTRALLARGVAPARLAVVELDESLSAFLRESVNALYGGKPEVTVISGDAGDLRELIPGDWVGKVDYVVSALPLMYMDEAARERIARAALAVLCPERGTMLHVTYSPASPLRFMENDVIQSRTVALWNNFPPGFVWRFTPKRHRGLGA